MNPQMLTESARIRTTVAEDIAIGSQSQSPDLQVYMQGVMLNGFVATALTSRNPPKTDELKEEDSLSQESLATLILGGEAPPEVVDM